MHSCLQEQELYGVVAISIFVGSLFFALFGGFLGQDQFRFYLPGFFELYPCLSSLLSLVSFHLSLFSNLVVEFVHAYVSFCDFVGGCLIGFVVDQIYDP